MDDDDASHYVYGPREKVSSSLHGRVGTIPARLAGYGERWDGDECTLWCEGVVQQSTVFGEDLHLIRRIEATVGSDEIQVGRAHSELQSLMRIPYAVLCLKQNT